MILKKIFAYIFSNFIQQFLGIFTSFSTRRFISPSDFGIWVTINMILSYCSYSNLGIFSAIYKEIPYYVGKKNFKAADSIKNLSGTFIILVGFIVSAIILILSFLLNIPVSLKIGLRVLSVMLFFTFISNFFITLFRAYNDFISLSKIILINSLVICFLYISFSFFWHLYGLYIAAILSLLVIIAYIITINKGIAVFHFIRSVKEFKNLLPLLKIGLSLLVVGFFYTILTTTERWVIINKLGLSQLGYYSIAIMFFEGIGQVSLLIGHITFSKIQNLYGEMGKNDVFDVHVKKYLSKLTLYMAYILPIAIGIIFVWGSFLVSKFIPKYTPGLASMNILIIGGLFIGLSHFSNNFLLTLNKYLLTIPLLIGSTLVILLLSFYFIHKGLGIEGTALAATIGYFLFFIAVSWMALRNIHTPYEIGKLYLNIFFTLIYYGSLIFLCTRLKLSHIYFTLPFQTFVLLIGSLPVLIKFNRETGFLKALLKQLPARRIKV